MKNNQEMKPEQTLVMNKFTLNQYETKSVMMDNKEYLIVPVVMIVQGVLNNLLYSNYEMAYSEELWNGRTVVIDHPSFGSANTVDYQLTNGIGTLYNTFMDTGSEDWKLCSECWIEKEVLRIKNPELLSRIENKEIIEVSTGLFVSYVWTEGADFKGIPFKAVATSHRPDHLAILPNDTGACSVTDGCGLRETQVNNEEKETTMSVKTNCNCPKIINEIIENGLRTEAEREFLMTLNKEEVSAIHSLISANEEVVAEVEPAKVEEAEVVAEEVVAEEVAVEAEPVKAEEVEVVAEKVKENSEEAEVTPEVEAVKAEEVEVVAEVEPEVKEEVEAETVEAEEVEAEASISEESLEANKEKFSKEFFAKINSALRVLESEKNTKIESILKNESNLFEKEVLINKDLEELNKLEALSGNSVNYGLASNHGEVKSEEKLEGLKPASF